MTYPDSWQVCFLTWDVFMNIMVKREKNSSWGFVWDHMDLIVGGLNFGGDFL